MYRMRMSFGGYMAHTRTVADAEVDDDRNA